MFPPSVNYVYHTYEYTAISSENENLISSIRNYDCCLPSPVESSRTSTNLRRNTNNNATPNNTHIARINGMRFSGGDAGAIMMNRKIVRISNVPSTGTTP